MNFKLFAVVALICLAMCLSFAAFTRAADVTLAWDANDPAPEGYRIFTRTIDGAYDYDSPAWEGSETTGTVTKLVEGQQYAFVVRAYDGDLESADSDEVVYAPPVPPKQIIYPMQPQSITIVFNPPAQ
jgi:hypothetical protein